MKTCPVCGFHNPETERSCTRCSGLLKGSISYGAEDFLARQADRPRRGPRLGGAGAGLLAAKLFGRASRLLRPLAVTLPEDVIYRNPWKAAFLGLLPGAGQIYNHQPLKAFYFVGAWGLALGLATLTFYHRYSNLVLGLVICWGVYGFHDGFKTALKINRAPLSARRSIGAYLAWILYLALFAILGQFVSSAFFIRFRYVRQPDLAPHLLKGDRIGIDMLSYKFIRPKPGDIVYYRPKKVILEQGANVWVVNAWSAMERVLAGPGQTFERRGEKYFLDGVEVSPDNRPLVTREVTWDYKFTAPAGQYVVLLSHTGGEMLQRDAPSLGAVTVVKGWEEACLVSKRDIVGRVRFVYHPPPRRRLFRRPQARPSVKDPAR